MKTLLILLGFLLIITNAQFPECSPQCSLPPMTCNFINHPIYTVGLDLPSIESNVSNLLETAAPLKQLQSACYDALQRLVCSFFYPSCNNDTSTSTSTAIKPCVSTCYESRTACSVLFDLGYPFTPQQQQLFNCSATDPLSGDDIWDHSSSSSSPSSSPSSPSPSPSSSPSLSPSSDTCFRLDSLTPVCSGPNTTRNDVSGKCELFSTETARHTGDLCYSFVSDEIFVRSAISQSMADDAINSTSLWLIRKIYPLMPLGCYKAVLSLMCQTAFPSCKRVISKDENNENDGEVMVPSFPCQSFCEHTNNVCGEFFMLVNQTKFDCTANDMFTSGTFRQWPQNTQTLRVEGKKAEVECQPNLYSDSSKNFIPPHIESCPFPMAKKPNPTDKDNSCWIPCPDPTYAPKQWDDLISVGQLFASLSFVTCLFLVVSGFVDSTKRRFPTNIHLFLALSAGMSSIAFFINGDSPKTTTWCNDATTYANSQNNSRCAAQGFIFILFTLSLLTWWMVLAFNTFIAVVLMTRFKGIRHLQLYYHIFAWGIPLLFAIILLGTDSVGYTPPASWCFITGTGVVIDPNVEPEIGLDYGLFYIPVGIGLGISGIFLIAVLIKIFMISRASKSIASQSNVAIKAQQRIIILISVMLILFALVFEWRFALDNSVKDNFKEEDFAWGLCKIKQQLQIDDGNPGHCPGDTFPKVFDYGHTMFETFLCSSLGLFIFFIFGTDIRIFQMWINIFTLAKNGEKDKLRAYLKDNSKTSLATPTTGGSSSHVPSPSLSRPSFSSSHRSGASSSSSSSAIHSSSFSRDSSQAHMISESESMSSSSQI